MCDSYDRAGSRARPVERALKGPVEKFKGGSSIRYRYTLYSVCDHIARFVSTQWCAFIIHTFDTAEWKRFQGLAVH